MKNIKTLLLIIAISVILFLTVFFLNIITERDNTLTHLRNFTVALQIKEEVYSFNTEINNKMTGLHAPYISYTKSDDLSKENSLSELVKNKPLLIYRYSDVNCVSCYENEIKTLQESFSDLLESAVILCSYQSDRDLRTFRRLNIIKLPLYCISFDAFTWTVEDYGNPYYFVLHPNMKISHIYVPDKRYPELNKQYLEGVKRFLLE